MVKYFSVNEENCSVRCKLFCDAPDGIRKIVLCCHGFGGNKDSRSTERFALRALEKNKGLAVVAFDWPAHGQDARKRLILQECDTYLRLMLAYIQTHWAPEELYAYAVSFGGYLTLRYLSDHGNPFRKIALRSPAVPMYTVLSNRFLTGDAADRIAKGKPALVGFDRKIEITADLMADLKETDITQRDYLEYAEDLLILHGTKDEIVPPEAVKAFAEENLIEFVPVPNADHRFSDPKTMEFAVSSILRFFALR